MDLRFSDFVCYNEKHNEANGEDNRDGTNDNHSWNCGAEGPTDDPDVHRTSRATESKLSGDAAPFAGRPMICGGDESGARSEAITMLIVRTTS